MINPDSDRFDLVEQWVHYVGRDYRTLLQDEVAIIHLHHDGSVIVACKEGGGVMLSAGLVKGIVKLVEEVKE